MYKVMLVDDEPLVRQYIRMHFEGYHPDWVVAEEAMDGLEAWEKLGVGRVDLVITDIKMPGLNGIELCKRIAQMADPPQVLILSGFDEFGLAQEAIRYNVRNYLLKPVVKEELLTAVQEVTAWLDTKGRESLALFTQNSISKDSQIQVVKQFLKAVIEDSSVEIKTLYPLIYRLKVQLIETEGIIMVLDLDEETMIRRGIPLSDYAVFRFILQQIAWEISDDAGLGYVFLDEDQMTCMLLTGEDREHIMQRCWSLYRSVSEAVKTNTGITVSGALGTFESEIFNLQTSYSNAAHYLQARLWSGVPGLFVQTTDDQTPDSPSIHSLQQALALVKYALFDQNQTVIKTALQQYIGHVRQFTTTEVVKFGIQLAKGLDEENGRSVERTYQLLGSVCKEYHHVWTKDSVLALFLNLASGFAPGMNKPDPAPADEWDVANRARAYICAHYEEPLSLALLAEKLGVSPGYLSQTFHRTFQETYIKFLTRIRMEQAAKLLKAQPPEKVYDIAEKVGYISVKHFSHVFKQHYHMPPGEYQEQHTSGRRNTLL